MNLRRTFGAAGPKLLIFAGLGCASPVLMAQITFVTGTGSGTSLDETFADNVAYNSAITQAKMACTALNGHLTASLPPKTYDNCFENGGTIPLYECTVQVSAECVTNGLAGGVAGAAAPASRGGVLARMLHRAPATNSVAMVKPPGTPKPPGSPKPPPGGPRPPGPPGSPRPPGHPSPPRPSPPPRPPSPPKPPKTK